MVGYLNAPFPSYPQYGQRTINDVPQNWWDYRLADPSPFPNQFNMPNAPIKPNAGILAVDNLGNPVNQGQQGPQGAMRAPDVGGDFSPDGYNVTTDNPWDMVNGGLLGLGLVTAPALAMPALMASVANNSPTTMLGSTLESIFGGRNTGPNYDMDYAHNTADPAMSSYGTFDPSGFGYGIDPATNPGGAGGDGGYSGVGSDVDLGEMDTGWSEAFGGDTDSGADSGSCFLTTAACEHMGLSDDCHELQTLRWFRDNVMAQTEQGRAEIAEYYRIAPGIVGRMTPEDKGKTWDVVRTAVEMIEAGAYGEAWATYRALVRALA